jgi:protein TonB
MVDETLTQPRPEGVSALVMEPPSSNYGTTGREGHELDALLGKAFEEKPIWTTLYENIRDVFFPVKLPPLQVTSKPIDVPDRMKVPRNPWAVGISMAFNISVLLIAIFFVGRQIIKAVHLEPTNVDVGVYIPKAPLAKEQAGGGGGGGEHSVVDPIKGHLPKIQQTPLAPPMVKTFEKPLIEAPPAINVQKDITLPDNPTLPNIGATQSRPARAAGRASAAATAEAWVRETATVSVRAQAVTPAAGYIMSAAEFPRRFRSTASRRNSPTRPVGPNTRASA